MEGIIKIRNGNLYVLYTYDEQTEPFRQLMWWRILETHSAGYGERPQEGDIVTYKGAGIWSARSPETLRVTGTITTGNGSTTAETVERVSIPAPPARGKEMRWHDGRWERLMARGWRAA